MTKLKQELCEPGATEKGTGLLLDFIHGKTLATKPITENKINKNASGFDGFYSPKQAAALLGVSYQFIYERMARGDIESQPVGRLKRIRRSALEAWLNSQKRRVKS